MGGDKKKLRGRGTRKNYGRGRRGKTTRWGNEERLLGEGDEERLRGERGKITGEGDEQRLRGGATRKNYEGAKENYKGEAGSGGRKWVEQGGCGGGKTQGGIVELVRAVGGETGWGTGDGEKR